MLWEPTPDQEFFRDTTARFLRDQAPPAELRRLRDDPAGFDSGYWRRGAELGWTSLLVTEWPASEKADLEALMSEGRGVAVAFSGCQMRVLPQCRLRGAYTWQQTTAGLDYVEIDSESDPLLLSGMLYDDGVIDPRDTRTVLGIALSAVHNGPVHGAERFGVFRP